MNSDSKGVFYQMLPPQAEAYCLFYCKETCCLFVTDKWLDFCNHYRIMHGKYLPQSTQACGRYYARRKSLLAQSVVRVHENTDSNTHSKPAHLLSGAPPITKGRHVLQHHKVVLYHKLKQNTIFCGVCQPTCTFETMEMFYKHNQDVHGIDFLQPSVGLERDHNQKDFDYNESFQGHHNKPATVPQRQPSDLVSETRCRLLKPDAGFWSQVQLSGQLSKLKAYRDTPLPGLSCVNTQRNALQLKDVQSEETDRSIRLKMNHNEKCFDDTKSSQIHTSEPPAVGSQRQASDLVFGGRCRKRSAWYDSCHICGLVFSTRTLMDHVASHKQYRHKLQQYYKSSQGHLSEPAVVQRSSRRSSFWYGPCHICGLKFSTKTLMDHIASHKQYRNKYICSFCKCSFNSIQTLRSHGAKMHKKLRVRYSGKGSSGQSNELTDAHDLQHLQYTSSSAYFEKEESWEFNAGNHIEALLGKISKFSGSDKNAVEETTDLIDEDAMAAESGIHAECIMSKECAEGIQDDSSQAMPPIKIAAPSFDYCGCTKAPALGETSDSSRCSDVNIGYTGVGKSGGDVVSCDESFEISSVQMDREEKSKTDLFGLLDDSEGSKEGSGQTSGFGLQCATGQKVKQKVQIPENDCEVDGDGETSLFGKFSVSAVKMRKGKQLA